MRFGDMAPTDDATKRLYRDEAHAINARDVRFDFDSVPMHYIPGEVLATHIVNVMHLVLPERERAMAAALSEALPCIEDERLRLEVVGFIGQETMHANSHEAARSHLQSIGLGVDSYAAKIAWLVDRVLGDHWLGGRAKQQWLKERLGLFAGMEHYTAVLGEWLLDAEVLEARGMHPAMLDLVRWHGAEEVEHRSDPSPDKGRFWLWQFWRATRRGVIPSWTVFFTELPRYLRPGFHPSQLGSMDIDGHRAAIPGAFPGAATGQDMAAARAAET